MQDRPKTRSGSMGFLIAATSVVVLAAGGGMAWWAYKSLFALAPSPVTTEIAEGKKPSEEIPAEIYWIDATGEEIDFVATPVTIDKSADKKEILIAAVERLLAGPSDPSHTTTIPKGTKLLGLSAELDGVHVNLSAQFKEGGGSASAIGRLGQIVYTATTSNPEDPVWIDVEGEPLEVLGGEGAIVQQPMTRKNFERDFMP